MNFNEKISEVTTEFIKDEWQNVDLLLGAIREDLSLQILRTEPNEPEKRNELYYTAKAVDAFAIKLQECINNAKTHKETK